MNFARSWKQSLRFSRPVRVGDTLTVTVTVLNKEEGKNRVELDCLVTNQQQEKVLAGVARVLAPTEKVRQPRIQAPQIQLFDPEARLKALLAQGRELAAVRCGVVHACHPGVLEGALRAAREGLIDPVLIGPTERIRETAERGAAVLLISTELDEILELSHRVAVMDQGRIAGIVPNDDAARRRIGELMSGVSRE